MKVVRTVDEMRAAVRSARAEASSLGLVPTMGALHEGHLSLVSAARAATDAVVLSIFVNPLQFGPSEDLAAYPRDEDRDLDVARERGVDIAWLPGVADMYPQSPVVTVDPGPLGEVLEGAVRPGHFAGVCTVVAKLLNVVSPDVAFFGQKDAQQATVIRRMVADLSIPVDIVVCPTVRESDGLALSSRNVYLSPDDRKRATVLWRALQAGRDALAQGGGPAEAEEAMAAVYDREGIDPDYARVVDPDTFEPATGSGTVVLVTAARVGAARLMDNVVVER